MYFEIKLLTCLRHYVRNTRKHRFLVVKILTYVAFSPHRVCPPVCTYSEELVRLFDEGSTPSQGLYLRMTQTHTYLPSVGLKPTNPVFEMSIQDMFLRTATVINQFYHILWYFCERPSSTLSQLQRIQVKKFLTVDISFGHDSPESALNRVCVVWNFKTRVCYSSCNEEYLFNWVKIFINLLIY
jgi:hypothetical protein